MKNISILLLVIVLFFPLSALAVCPVCSIAAAGGVGLSRWLGVDDVISGLWVGGLIISSVIWLLAWLDKKRIKFKLRWLAVLASSCLIIVTPLYWMGIMGKSCNRLWGFDRLLVGIFFGSLTFYLGVLLHNLLKKRNNSRVYLPFQKVIIPITFLLTASVIFYFIVKCY